METPVMRENHGSAASCTPHPGDPAHNRGLCPDRESNPDLLVPRSMLDHGATPTWVFCFVQTVILQEASHPRLAHPESLRKTSWNNPVITRNKNVASLLP